MGFPAVNPFVSMTQRKKPMLQVTCSDISIGYNNSISGVDVYDMLGVSYITKVWSHGRVGI